MRVLGPLEVAIGGQVVGVSGSMPRRLLALLALRQGREVSTDELIDGMWPDTVSAGAGATLQSHVARLRRSLGHPELIATGASGYQLVVEPSGVDAVRFEQAITSGRDALERGEPVSARQHFAGAVDLWRGRPYAEFHGSAVLEIEATRLEQLRLDALVGLLTAELACPDVEPPVAQLQALVGLHPSHESLWALLMLALYRSGRQADALAAYQQVRTHLVEELGLEPGRELQEMEGKILAGDAALEPARARPGGATDAPGVPELRLASVIAVRAVTDGIEDPEQVARQHAQIETIARNAADAYQAAPVPSSSGLVLFVLGAPTMHEDDAYRAVHLSWTVRTRCREAGSPVAVGVATGIVLATSGDGQVTVAGEPVSLARRQTEVGRSDDLIVDPATADLVRGVVAVEHTGSGAFRIAVGPAGPGPRPVTHTPFVGRAAELASLRGALERTVSERRPELVTIVGEAGVGKTRLAAEFSRAVHRADPDVRWVASSCLPFGESDAFQGITDIVRALAAVTDEDSDERAADKILAMLPPGEHETHGLRLTSLLGIPTSQVADRAASFEAWTRFLEVAATDHALVVQIDDLQWAPQLLLDFLEHLCGSDVDAPVLCLATARPEALAPDPGGTSAGRHRTDLSITRLSDSEIETMLASLCDATTLGTGDLTELAQSCAGVPYFAEEIARLQPLGGTNITTVRALIGSRLDTLGPDDRSILTAGAVAGRTFTRSYLADAGVLDGGRLAEVLDHLVQREFILYQPSTGAGGDRTYAFNHDILREVVYERVPRGERARLHLAVARWWWSGNLQNDAVAEGALFHALESRSLAVLAGRSDVVDAGRQLAVEVGLVVGHRLQGFDTGAALSTLRTTLELVEPGSPAEAQARLWYGAALFDDRQFVAAYDQVRSSLDPLEKLGDLFWVDAVITSLVCGFALGRPYDDEIAALERAVAELGPSVQLVRALSVLGTTAVMAQTEEDHRAAVDYADRALRTAADVAGIDGALAHVVRGRARLGLGDGGGLGELTEWLDRMATEESGTIIIGTHQWLAGAQHHWVGPAAEWETRVKVNAMARARGLEFLTSFSVAEEIRVLWELGDHRGAIDLADSDAVGRVEFDAQARWAVVQRAMALRELGELTNADVDLVRSTPPADDGDLRHVLGAALIAAMWDADGGDADAARCTLRSVGPLSRFGDRDGAAELLPGAVRLACALGCDDLLVGLEDGLDGRTPLRSILRAHTEGLLAAHRGESDRAGSLLRDALAGWESRGSTTEAAATRADLVRLEQAGRP